jgi:transposase
MDCLLTKITKKQIEIGILPFIPKNKRGFSPKVDLAEIAQCIIFKLKTGVQWNSLFVDIESINRSFSWQLVYYYYRKWSKAGVFEELFNTLLEVQKDKLDTENLNLDGTHSLVKKAGQSVGYQHRKKGRTSNVLIMTDGKGIPISLGTIVSGNHNDLYKIVPEFSKMVKGLKQSNICVKNSVLNADKGFDSKAFRRACYRRNIQPNIKENNRNRKKPKRGRKRIFNEEIYKRRFVNERCFAWLDSFRTLLIRFDFLDQSWINWHYLAFILILIKV